MNDQSSFQFFSPKTIIHGIHSLDSVVEEIRKLGGTKVLVVTDSGIREAGLLTRLMDRIQRGKIPVDVFDDVNPDPELRKVESCVSLLKKGGHDLVIGLGGGSPLDVAKYSAAFLFHEGAVRDYLGRHLLKRRGLSSIMIPTTAGTGSEVTWAAVFHDERDHIKKAVWSPFIQADSVIIDPSLTLSMPLELTIDTGMDALIHGFEACVAVGSSPITDALALEAIRLIHRAFRVVTKDRDNLEARYHMSLSAMLSGLAFCNSGLGAIHALALLLDSEYGFTHGRSLAVLTPSIMEFNLSARPDKYAQLALALGEKTGGLKEDEAARKAIESVISLADDLGISLKLRDYGIEKGNLEAMGKRAYEIGRRLLPMNPRSLNEGDSVRIYQEAY